MMPGRPVILSAVEESSVHSGLRAAAIFVIAFGRTHYQPDGFLKVWAHVQRTHIADDSAAQLSVCH